MKTKALLYSLVVILLIWGCNESKIDNTTDGFVSINVAQSNLEFSNDLTETATTNIIMFEYFYNGGGVGAGDINNDGLTDIYFTGNQVPNKLFLNKGNLVFEDITEKAGVAGKGKWSNGVTMADVNGDGFLDIYVSNSGFESSMDDRRNELFINNGDLTFSEKGAEFGLDDPSYSTQAMFLDIDLDNDLDMFLMNRPANTYKPEEALILKNSISEFAGDKLFRNDNGQFIDISQNSGINRNGLGYGLGLAAGDLNKDGLPDIYVSNDYVEPDYIYLNLGSGQFQEVGKTATKHMSNFGMGVDIADINNDTWPDIFVSDMAPNDNYRQKTMMKPMNPEQFYWAVYNGFHYQYMFNTLHLNNGDMTFSDVAQLAGIATTDWSWSTLFGDMDNDGWSDLFVTNGFRKEFSNKDFVKKMDKEMGQKMNSSLDERMKLIEDMLEEIPETKISNFIYRNDGDLSFEDVSKSWDLTDLTFSNGAAMADLDNDGDLDLIINNIDQKALLYRNDLKPANSLRLKLKGPAGNTSGIGAKITVFAQGKKQFKEHYLTKGYQSSSEDWVHFGLGQSLADSVEIIWPDGKRQVVEAQKGQLILDYREATQVSEQEAIDKVLLLSNVTEEIGLDYTHLENTHNDFTIEVLLPHQMSQFGPALAVGDINGDGADDFFIGGSSGNKGRVYFQTSAGKFEEVVQPAIMRDAFFEDVGAELLDVDGDDDLDLYVASGGNELLPGSPYYKDRLYLNNKGIFSPTILPVIQTSNGKVLPFDIDSDGDLDLFVGSRLNPMRYPTSDKSWVLINDKGSYSDATSKYSTAFNRLGMITDARWADLDKNGKNELIVVGEWTAIRVFELVEGKFSDKTEAYGLSGLTGWWYSLEIADINNDGYLDILAGNLGLNYKYKASEKEPFHVFYNDFDQNGSGDIVLGYYDDGNLFPLRGRQCSSEQIPSITEKFKTYDEFGKATLEEIYGEDKLEKSRHYTANTFASTALINRGGSFERMDFPRLAQVSSINSMIVQDFTGDGKVDILYAGNLYPVEIETTRNDASYGGLLVGDGTGKFSYSSYVETGFKADGDVKHLQKIGLNKGEEGILVARNSGALELFRINKIGK